MSSPREPFIKPILLEGSGDSLLDVNIPGGSPGVARIQGNAAGRYFSVRTFDANSEAKPLVTIARVPYTGLRPINFYRDDRTTQIEVSAIGDWSIELLPLSHLERVQVPGSTNGSGDYVFIIAGKKPDQAIINHDDEDKYFDVITYGKRRIPLVSSNKSGTRVYTIDSDARLVEVQAVGPWEIEFTE